MGKTYSEKLQDPRWQKKRLQILERDNWKCRHCKEGNKSMHVHHVAYYKNYDPWDYEDEELESLCLECHQAHEEAKRGVMFEVGKMTAKELKALEMFSAMARLSGGHKAIEDACTFLASNYVNASRVAAEMYLRLDIVEQ